MRILISLPLFVSTLACSPKIDIEKTKKEVIEADIAFFELSKKAGVNQAFINYVHDSGVLLRPLTMPIIGKEAVRKQMSLADSSYTLVWHPLFVDVASSGDMAYTYGTYELFVKSDTSKTEGTYVSIWKKNKNGEWKFVLDSGNEGLKPNNQ